MPAAEKKEIFENPSNSKITYISLNLTAIPLSKLYLYKNTPCEPSWTTQGHIMAGAAVLLCLPQGLMVDSR